MMMAFAQTATSVAQIATLGIGVTALLINAAVVIVAVRQIRATEVMAREDHEKARRLATLSHFTDLNDRNLENLKLLNSEFKRHEPVPRERVLELMSGNTKKDKNLRNAIRALLNDLEYLATGANFEILDADVLDEFANFSIRDAADKYQYWIAEAQARGSATMYSNLVTLAKDFTKRRKRRTQEVDMRDSQHSDQGRLAMTEQGFDTTTDRENIPKLNESKLITLDETRLAKVAASLVAAVGVIGAGVLAWLGVNVDSIAKDSGLVVAGAGLLVGVSIFSWALVAAADIRARGDATAANLALRSIPATTTLVAPAGLPGESSGLWAHIKKRESGDLHLVVGSREQDDKTLLLLARHDEVPTWKSLDDLDGFTVKAPSQ